MITIKGRFLLTPFPGVHLLSLPSLSTTAAAAALGCRGAVRGGHAVSVCIQASNKHILRQYGGATTALQREGGGLREGNRSFEQRRSDIEWRRKQQYVKEADSETRRDRRGFEKGQRNEDTSRSFRVNRRESFVGNERRERLVGGGSRQNGNFASEIPEKEFRSGLDFRKGQRSGERSKQASQNFDNGSLFRRSRSFVDEDEVKPWEGRSKQRQISDTLSRQATSKDAGRFRRSVDAFPNSRGRHPNGSFLKETTERSMSGSKILSPSETGWSRTSADAFQNGRERHSSGRFLKETTEPSTTRPRTGYQSASERGRFNPSARNYQDSNGKYSSGRFSGEYQEAASSNPRNVGVRRGRTHPMHEATIYRDSRRNSPIEEPGANNRIRKGRSPEVGQRGSVNNYSEDRAEMHRAGMNSRRRVVRQPGITGLSSFGKGRTEREETRARFGRPGVILHNNRVQYGGKERRAGHDSMRSNRDRSKHGGGETHQLPENGRAGRAIRDNTRNQAIPLRPFEEFVEVQAESREQGQQDPSYDMSSGEELAKKKLDALVKELSGLYFRYVNKTLTDKANWIENKEVKQIVEHMLCSEQVSHAYQALKWAEKQFWFEADFELITRVCNECCHRGVLAGAYDLFSMLKRSSFTPEASTYEALIGAYLKEGTTQFLTLVWELYHEMNQLGEEKPSFNIKLSLFRALTERPQEKFPWLDLADGLFESIKSSGVSPSTEMYASLIHLHALNCNAERLTHLLQEMKASGLKVSTDTSRIVLNMWANIGKFEELEKFYQEITYCESPDWYNYVHLIEAYLKGGLRSKALQVLDAMVNSIGTLKTDMYEALISAMAKADERENAENLLKGLEELGCQSSQIAYHSIMNMYVRQHLFKETEILFERMETKGCQPDQDSYHILITSHLENRHLDKAEEVYEKLLLKEISNPNQKTYNLMLENFGKAGQWAKLSQVHEQLLSHSFKVPFELRQYLKAAGLHNGKVKTLKPAPGPRLEKSQREILAGVLLGGAQIESLDQGLSNEIHFELSSTSPVGKALFYHLHKEFICWAKDPPLLRSAEVLDDNGSAPEDKVLHFATSAHPTFRFFARHYRPNGKPAIPRLIHRWLTSRTLAYWYMYGGYKCPLTGRIVLNASHYSTEEISPILRTLKATLVKRDSGNVIHFYGNSEVAFWTVVKPFILPELVDVLQPSGDQFNSTDNGSWEELEGAIIAETKSNIPEIETADANDEAVRDHNHHFFVPLKASNLELKADVKAQTSVKAARPREEKKSRTEPNIWERLAEIVQAEKSN